MADQRRSFRKSLKVAFKGSDSEGSGHLEWEAADLSPGGTFLVSDLLLEQDEPLALELHLPGDGAALKLRAEVAWVRRFPNEDEPAGMGVRFVGMSEVDRRRLEQFVSAA